MASRASGCAITAKLHFPEKRLTQRDGSRLIANQIVQLACAWTRHRNRLQRANLVATTPALTASAGVACNGCCGANAAAPMVAATVATATRLCCAGVATVAAAIPIIVL